MASPFYAQKMLRYAAVYGDVRALMDFSELVGRRLVSVWFSRTTIHEAWVDASTPSIATYRVNLELSESNSVQVAPCEVLEPGRYPSLGIELGWLDGPVNSQRGSSGAEYSVDRFREMAGFLPASIDEALLWDSLGEGAASAVDIVLSTGAILTIRHIYPPMTLGIELWPEGRNEL